MARMTGMFAPAPSYQWTRASRTEVTASMKKDKKPAAPYRVVRVFTGKRTAAQVVADLMKVHSAAR